MDGNIWVKGGLEEEGLGKVGVILAKKVEGI